MIAISFEITTEKAEKTADQDTTADERDAGEEIAFSSFFYIFRVFTLSSGTTHISSCVGEEGVDPH